MIKVLIVDDSKIMRNAVSVRIKECGFKVIGQAENGHEAITKFRLLKPDIVTMDITMPEINQINDGIAAVREIKKIDPNANIVMITSHGEEKKVMDAISAGARGYILKPVTTQQIRKVFRKLREKLVVEKKGSTISYSIGNLNIDDNGESVNAVQT